MFQKVKIQDTIERIQNIHEVINEIFERKRKEDPKSTREIVKEIQELSKRGFVTPIVSTLI